MMLQFSRPILPITVQSRDADLGGTFRAIDRSEERSRQLSLELFNPQAMFLLFCDLPTLVRASVRGLPGDDNFL